MQVKTILNPADSDVDHLLWRIAHRVSVLLDKTVDDAPTDDETRALQVDQAAALTPPLPTPTPSPDSSRTDRTN